MKASDLFRLALCIGLVTASTSAASSAPRELNLKEVLDLAEQVNHAIAAAESREAATQATVGIARSNYLPDVDLEAIDTTGFPGSTSLLGIGGVMGSPYRSGAATGLVARETLWDFGRTSSSVEAAKHDTKASHFAIASTRFEVDRDAAKAFFDCVRYRSQEEIWTFVLQQAQLIEKEVLRFVSTGQRSVVERYLARSHVEEALTAQADYSERAKLALERVRILTGLRSEELSCPLADQVAREHQSTSPVGENPLILRAEEEALAAQARAKQAKAGYLPKIIGLGSYGLLEKSRLVKKEDYALGIGIVIPLFDGLRTTEEVHRARQIEAEKEFLIQANREQTEQVNSRFDEVIRSSSRRLVHLTNELGLAEEGFKVAKRRYFSLQGTLVDLRESLRNLTRTRTQYTDSEIDEMEANTAKMLYNDARPRGA